MSNIIELHFDNSITMLTGNQFGKHIYKTQVEDKVDYGDSQITLIFPERIDLVASSFIQGFFEGIIENVGIVGIESNLKIKSSIEDLKLKIIEDLK